MPKKKQKWEPVLTPGEIDRFWSKVQRAPGKECWIWKGMPDHSGYGHFTIRGWMFSAHRTSFYVSNGNWPKGIVRHKCDNPPCVRPSHLEDGTPKENAQDTVSRGRHGRRPERIADLKAEIMALRSRVSQDRISTERVRRNLSRICEIVGIKIAEAY